VDMLSNPSGYSIVTPWDKVLRYNPEVLVVAPCGFNVERAAKEIEILTSKEGWKDLLAVKNNEVYLADAEYFTQPGTKLVDGIELLAALFHPTIFKVPQKLNNSYLSISKAAISNEK
jgi:iron complex transport system substrate-binding protein